ncbi:MAG: hypothetical protein D6780_01265, partial [Candidatus Dadabacteria bacterium]
LKKVLKELNIEANLLTDLSIKPGEIKFKLNKGAVTLSWSTALEEFCKKLKLSVSAAYKEETQEN